MTQYYTVKETATTAIDTTIRDDSGVVDLTGADVGVTITPADGSTPVVDTAATVTDATSGTVEFQLPSSVTDTPGRYLVEWTVDGGTETFKYPRHPRYETLIVSDALSTGTLSDDGNLTTFDAALDAGFT